MPPNQTTPQIIAICGAGPTGLALAILLAKQGIDPRSIALLDAKPQPAQTTATTKTPTTPDPRSIALSQGSAQLLQTIGAWPITATPIQQIHISRRGHFGRTLMDAAEYNLPALGYVTRYSTLVEALNHAVVEAGITTIRAAQVEKLEEHHQNVKIHLVSGETMNTAMVVQAEGGLFGEQATKNQTRDYHQTAIVAQVAVTSPIMHRAFERFTEEGPIALLPQKSESNKPGIPSDPTHYALVWCVRPGTASKLMALPEEAFLKDLGEAFGTRLGCFRHVSQRHMYSLGLNADPAITARMVAIGNASQTLHPVAGQGLNLGLRDATVLARCLSQEISPSALLRFQKERRIDRKMTIGITDTMARIFAGTPDGSLPQTLLGLSLGLIDGVAPIRKLLADQMMFGRR